MSTKIQINSLEALERLIGNDTELEIQVRNNIVQEFAKKHLKAIANEQTFKYEIDTFKRELQKEFDKRLEESIATIKRYYSGSSIEKVTLHEEVRLAIDRQVRESVEKRIVSATDDALKFWANSSNIEERIENRMNRQITEQINQSVKTRLAELANKLTS